MRELWQAWFAERPTARAALLFSGLNMLPVLIFTLVFPPLLPGMQTLPFFSPLEIAVRVAFAALVYSVIVWVLRPGNRSGRDLWWLGGATLLLATVFAHFYPLLLWLTVLPLLLRNWLSFRNTLLVSLLIVLPLAAVDTLLNHFLNMGSSVDWNRWLELLPWWVALGVVVNLFTLTGFEFAYREAQLRHNLAALAEAQREFAALSERARISRELHDTLGHHLMTTRLNLQLLSRQGVSEEGTETLATLEQTNAAAIGDLREVVRLLRPLGSDHSLTEALEKLLNRPEVTFTVQGEELPLNEAQRLTLYRAAQESLSNALKHAPSEHLNVALRFDEDGVSFQATNAAAPALADPAGLGLTGLRERISELGGEFKVVRQHGLFTVRLRLPL